MVREIIRRARAYRWKPHAALFKLNPVRIIIGGQLGPSQLIPRDRICEYEEEKRTRGVGQAEEAGERERLKRLRRRGSRVAEKREREEGKIGTMRAGEAGGRRNGRENEEVR